MARLARPLKNRCDIFTEGRRLRGRRSQVRIIRQGSASDRDLHLSIRPAAVIPEVTRGLAGTIVDDGLKDILAGFAEYRSHDGASIRYAASCRFKSHGAGPTILRPHRRHSHRL